jgi:hypothetical protein
MDTAQRGMGLQWADARQLALRTLADAQSVAGRVVVGIGTDQLSDSTPTLAQIRDAYLEQIATVESAGGDVVMMASRHLACVADGPDAYATVYDEVLSAVTRPVVLHWLGSAFDPALIGYWGFEEPKNAIDTVLQVIVDHPGAVRGIKLSLLDAGLETAMRDRIPAHARVFTGDDYNYIDMIAAGSDALLGAFAAVAPFVSAAMARLDTGDERGFREILGPTEHLSRLLFAAPTQYYKAGVAWLAYLNGKQDHFRMIGGLESGRSLLHLADLVRAANAIGLFTDPHIAAARASAYFTVHGVTAPVSQHV